MTIFEQVIQTRENNNKITLVRLYNTWYKHKSQFKMFFLFGNWKFLIYSVYLKIMVSGFVIQEIKKMWPNVIYVTQSVNFFIQIWENSANFHIFIVKLSGGHELASATQ
jgi:hypothetical protein